MHSLFGLVVARAFTEQEALGSTLGLNKVLLDFSITNFTVAVTVSGFVFVFQSSIY